MDIVRRRHCRKLLKKCLRVVTTALVNDPPALSCHFQTTSFLKIIKTTFIMK
jgi:hypothetical protein